MEHIYMDIKIDEFDLKNLKKYTWDEYEQN